MIVFLGFEGILSSKVIEDIRYDNLLLVNNLPSFFPKYKDISMINNCELLTSHHSKLKYVPANNPFEAYNFLDAVIDESLLLWEFACMHSTIQIYVLFIPYRNNIGTITPIEFISPIYMKFR